MEDSVEELSGLNVAGHQPNLNKEHINLVFIGHVGSVLFNELDAGKSTIGGQLLYLTGMVDKRTLEKYERESKELNRESWYLSWALDTSNEERAKGITVECGKGHFETEKKRFTVIDAPGHKNYVPNMLSGASQADIAILVISARKGEFETGFEKGGQTREHALLVKTGGVKRLIVVINKMDEPSVGWSEARYNEIVDKLTPYLKKCGYNLKTEVTFIPIAGLSGQNMKEQVPASICSWYKGPSFLQYLDEMAPIERNITAPFMMPISEKYKDMGTVVAGKIESGVIKKGQTALVMPNKNLVEILAVYDEDTEIPSAQCGDNVRLKLKGVEDEDISVGFVLCGAEKPVKVATSFDAQIAVEEIRNIISPGYTAVMHVHTCTEEVSIKAFIFQIDKKTNEKMPGRPRFVRQGDVVTARFNLNGPVCLEAFKDYPQLGRFILRDEGKTVARGKVLKVFEATDAQPTSQQ